MDHRGEFNDHRGEDGADHCHQFDEDVERGTGGVFVGIADNACLSFRLARTPNLTYLFISLIRSYMEFLSSLFPAVGIPIHRKEVPSNFRAGLSDEGSWETTNINTTQPCGNAWPSWRS